MVRRYRMTALSALAACWIAACGTTEPPAPVVGVTLATRADTLWADSTRQLTVLPTDAAGNAVFGRTVFWTSSDPAVASVEDGLVTGRATGEAWITATVEERQDSARITVWRPFLARTISVAGDLACASDLVGRPWCWGFNWAGAVGAGTTEFAVPAPAPVFRRTLEGVTAMGDHACGLDGGVAWCWGYNGSGQLGDGTIRGSVLPIPVSGGLTFSALGGSEGTTCGLSGGTAFCWGRTGPSPPHAFPQPVVTNLRTITVGYFHVCALDAGSRAYCWGSNIYGQLGGSTGFGAVDDGRVFVSLAAGGLHTCAVSSGGTASCWGRNYFGQLGDGGTTDRSAPTAVSAPTGLTFSAVTAGDVHTCAVTSQGQAFCWGNNAEGELGDGTTTVRRIPTPVATSLRFTELAAGHAFTCGLTAEGPVFCWGSNGAGRLGIDSRVANQLQPLVPVLLRRGQEGR